MLSYEYEYFRAWAQQISNSFWTWIQHDEGNSLAMEDGEECGSVARGRQKSIDWYRREKSGSFSHCHMKEKKWSWLESVATTILQLLLQHVVYSVYYIVMWYVTISYIISNQFCSFWIDLLKLACEEYSLWYPIAVS